MSPYNKVVFVVVSYLMLIGCLSPVKAAQADLRTGMIVMDENFDGKERPDLKDSGFYVYQPERKTLFADEFQKSSTAGMKLPNRNWRLGMANGIKVLSQTNPASGGSPVVIGQNDWSDCEIDARFALGEGTGGLSIGFRYQNQSNNTCLYFQKDGAYLIRTNKGKQNYLATATFPLKKDEFVDIRIVIVDDTYRFYSGDELLLTYADPAPIPSGRISLSEWQSVVNIASLTVKEVPESYSGNMLRSNGKGSLRLFGRESAENYRLDMSLLPIVLNEPVEIRLSQGNDAYTALLLGKEKMRLVGESGSESTVIDENDVSLSDGEIHNISISNMEGSVQVMLDGELILGGTGSGGQDADVRICNTASDILIDDIRVTELIPPMESIPSPGGTSYYLSDEGDDSNDGMSPETAWKSVYKASSVEYAAGDKLLLRAGDSFRGSLSIAANGTEDAPITIATFGEGERAVIESNTPGVLYARNPRHLVIDNLTVVAKNKVTLPLWDAVTAIKVDYSGSGEYSGLIIRNCVISGEDFRRATFGINITGVADNTGKPAVRGVAIRGNEIRNIGWAGITTTGWDAAVNKQYYAPDLFFDMLITENNLYDFGNQGIVGQCMSGGEISRNYVLNGGQFDGEGVTWGPGAVWCIGSRNVTIKFNEIANMKDSSSGYDGTGINIDWANHDITLMYNYVHGAYGQGASTMANANGRIIANKLIDNLGQTTRGECQINITDFASLESSSTFGVKNLLVKDNVIKVNDAGSIAIRTNSFTPENSVWEGNSIADNIVILKGVPTSRAFNFGEKTKIDFCDNNTIVTDNSRFAANVIESGYDSMDEWRKATGFDVSSRIINEPQTRVNGAKNLRAECTGDGIRVSWDVDGVDKGGGFLHYNVFAGTAPDFVPAYVNMVGETTETFLVDRERKESGIIYYYKLEAENILGDVTPLEPTASVKYAPGN